MTSAVDVEVQLQLQFEAEGGQDRPPEFFFAHYAPQLKCWTVAYRGPHCGTVTVHVECSFYTGEQTRALAADMNRTSRAGGLA